MGSQERERRPTLELAKNERFCDAIRELGETTDISTGLIDKCEEEICSIYVYKISGVNRVRYEILIKGAESRDILSRIHWFYAPKEPTTKLKSGRILLIKTLNLQIKVDVAGR